MLCDCLTQGRRICYAAVYSLDATRCVILHLAAAQSLQKASGGALGLWAAGGIIAVIEACLSQVGDRRTSSRRHTKSPGLHTWWLRSVLSRNVGARGIVTVADAHLKPGSYSCVAQHDKSCVSGCAKSVDNEKGCTEAGLCQQHWTAVQTCVANEVG